MKYRSLIIALSYFVIVFCVGFIFGSIRVLWAIPRFGVRTSELVELPFMVLASYGAARVIQKRFQIHLPREGLRVGLIATGVMLTAELAVGFAARGLSFAEILFNRDPISGTAYYMSLLFFGLMPFLLARKNSRPEM